MYEPLKGMDEKRMLESDGESTESLHRQCDLVRILTSVLCMVIRRDWPSTAVIMLLLSARDLSS